MNLIDYLERFTLPHHQNEDSARREHLAKAILVMVAAVLFVLTLLIGVGWIIRLFSLDAVVIMLLADTLVFTGWMLTNRYYFNAAGVISALLFFFLGFYLSFTIGLVHTGILFYGIAILLSGKLFGVKAQWLMVVLSIAMHLALGWNHEGMAFSDRIAVIFTVTSSMVGISLLEWYSTNQLSSAITAARENAIKLKAQTVKLASANRELQREIRNRIQTQDILEETKRVLSALMGNLPGMAYRCRNDKNWTMDFVSEGCLDLTGYHPDELLHNAKLSFNQIIHSEDQQAVWDQVQTALKKREHFELVYRIHTRDGDEKWVWEQGLGVFTSDGDVVILEGFVTDITEQKKAENALQQFADRMEVLHEIDQAVLAARSSADIANAALSKIQKLVPCDRGSVVLFNYENNTFRILAVSNEEGKILSAGENLPLEEYGNMDELGRGQPHLVEDLQAKSDLSKTSERLLSMGLRSILNAPMIFQDELIGVLNVGVGRPEAYNEEHLQIVSELGDSLAVAIENSILYNQSQQRAQILTSLYETALATSSILEVDDLAQRLYEQIGSLLDPDAFALVLFDEKAQALRIALAIEAGEVLPGWMNQSLPLSEAGLIGWVVREQQSLLIDDMDNDPLPVNPKHGVRPAKSLLGVPMSTRGRMVGAFSVQSFRPHAFNHSHLRYLESLAFQVAISLETARLFEETLMRTKELEALVEISSELRSALTIDEMLPGLLEKTVTMLGAAVGNAYILEQESDDLVARGWYPHDPKLIGLRHKLGEGVTGQVFSSNKMRIIENLSQDPYAVIHPQEEEILDGIGSAFSLPLRTTKRVLGVMHIGFPEQRLISDHEIRMASAIADMAANAILRATLFEQSQRRLAHLLAIRDIDKAITSTLDLPPILDILLDQTITRLNADAATVLLLSPHSNTLDIAARRGFRTSALSYSHLSLGEGYAGRAALEKRIIQVSDLEKSLGDLNRSKLIAQEGFASYFAVPLVVKGKVKGVLEVFNRTAQNTDREWFNFLEDLATQAAIAIDNSELFEGLQRSNIELSFAYDATIEGWSRALELRDQETEGHSQRVTNLTLEIARAMGMSAEKLVHIRRGSLLHDIGKMGVPDSILLKPGPLDEAEWDIMRMHPIYAHGLLASIPYLRPALEIPYCHHEKWDGTGYPRGLKGEQIPLEARIFAVVDVWDALRSDRPYREAWPEERAMQYIKEQAGRHFDPDVAKVFLKIAQKTLTE